MIGKITRKKNPHRAKVTVGFAIRVILRSSRVDNYDAANVQIHTYPYVFKYIKNKCTHFVSRFKIIIGNNENGDDDNNDDNGDKHDNNNNSNDDNGDDANNSEVIIIMITMLLQILLLLLLIIMIITNTTA